MARKSEKQQQSTANPFSVKKTSKRSSRKTRPNKKYDLEAVDREFASVCRDSLKTDSESSDCKELSGLLVVKTLPGSACINDIVKRTKSADIS